MTHLEPILNIYFVWRFENTRLGKLSGTWNWYGLSWDIQFHLSAKITRRDTNENILEHFHIHIYTGGSKNYIIISRQPSASYASLRPTLLTTPNSFVIQSRDSWVSHQVHPNSTPQHVDKEDLMLHCTSRWPLVSIIASVKLSFGTKILT